MAKATLEGLEDLVLVNRFGLKEFHSSLTFYGEWTCATEDNRY